MNSITLKSLTTLVLFAASASAQNINMDVGDNLILYPAPSNAYGAAAGQTGFWNAVAHPYSATLKLLDGSVSGVTCTSTTSSSYSYFPSTLTGDDYNFMVDCQNLDSLSGTQHWHFAGLADGN